MLSRRLFIPMLLFILILVTTSIVSCDDSTPQAPEKKIINDTAPPATVTDLTVISSARSSLTLIWKAPGDDGMTGQAALYDLRFSSSLITDQNWETATPVSGVSKPKPGGQVETIIVTDLPSEANFYFALKTYDEVPNESGLSNCASGTTKQMSPARITDLQAAAISDTEFRLTWTATGDDGMKGTASYYDIRYSTSDVTKNTWNSATKANGESAPKPSGVQESFTITGLNPGTNYTFAMKVGDEVPNWSDISNICPALTLGENLWITPRVIFPGDELGITFRASASEATSVAIWRPVKWGPEIIYGIIKHLVDDYRLPGVYFTSWDLTYDNGEPLNIPYISQCIVKLQWGGVTVDSMFVRIHPNN